jgi:AcrR family transcriptional regulator
MRGLADALKIDPMSIYHHVGDKDAVLDGLVDVLWDEVQPPTGEMSWKDTLRTFATSLRELGHVHPQAYGLLCGRGILPGPGLRVIDTALAALERAGLNRGQAAEMIRTLVAYAVGYATLELSAAPTACTTGLEQIVRLTQALPRDTPVHLVEVARLMADCDMDYQFTLGLDLILTGLEARLAQP